MATADNFKIRHTYSTIIDAIDDGTQSPSYYAKFEQLFDFMLHYSSEVAKEYMGGNPACGPYMEFSCDDLDALNQFLCFLQHHITAQRLRVVYREV